MIHFRKSQVFLIAISAAFGILLADLFILLNQPELHPALLLSIRILFPIFTVLLSSFILKNLVRSKETIHPENEDGKPSTQLLFEDNQQLKLQSHRMQAV